MYHVDGGRGLALVTAPPGLRKIGAAFGAGRRYIWYAQRQGTWKYNAIFPQYQLGVYDRETGTRTTMTNRYGSAFRPALSPDGKWLVYGVAARAETGSPHPRARDRRRALAGVPDSAGRQESRADSMSCPATRSRRIRRP